MAYIVSASNIHSMDYISMKLRDVRKQFPLQLRNTKLCKVDDMIRDSTT